MNNIFSKLRPLSLRSQLVYGIGLILTLLIVTFVYITTKSQSEFLRKEGLKQATNRSLALATASKVWIMSNDFVGLEEVLDSFTTVYDDSIFATVINLDGKVIAHTENSLIGKYIADKQRMSYLENMTRKPLVGHVKDEEVLLYNRHHIDIIRMVHFNDKHIGMVNIRIDQTDRQKNIKAIIMQGVIFSVFSLITAILFAFMIVRGLTNEITELIALMKRASQGDRSIRADEDGTQEIATLSHEFNNMIYKLNVSEKSYEDLTERLKLAFEGSQDGLWDWNILNDTVYYSIQWKNIIGYGDELPDLLSSWQDRVHPDDLEKALKDVNDHIEGKTEVYKNIHRLKHKDGHWVWTLDRGKALYDKNGKATRMVGTNTDISEEKDLQLKFALQAQVLKQVHDSIISTDLDGNIVSWNKGSEKMLGYSADEVIGQHMSIIQRPEDEESMKEYLNELFRLGSLNIESYLVRKSKTLVLVSVTLSLLKDKDEKIIGMIGVSQDITQRKKAEAELLQQKNILDYQAHHDALTGLPNRILFNDRLLLALEKAKRHKGELALFFIDLDRFKQINDSLGHVTGDKVLQEVSRRLVSTIRKEDSLARLGGDEFTVLVDDLNKGQDASFLAQKILSVLSEPLFIDDHTLYVSSSIGISLYPQDSTDRDKLLMYADAAMYKAKDEGRNNFQFYSTEMTALAFEHVVLETSLRKAISNEEFVVYYQPQVNALKNQLIGMEALVRWNHPEMGLVSPIKFIPIAEETGLIIQIDRFVMKTAMKQVAQWYKNNLNPGVLALNLAVRQLHTEDFITVLKDMLSETECKAEWIELEVTEGQIMKNPEDAIAILNQISDLGIELAIDDFGTGYSSLSYLKRLPVNKLKIDQSFIRHLPYDNEDAGISKAVIALATSLNLSVIAEGVETKEQKDFLIENSCHNIQGYFYSKPVPSEEMEAILREDNWLTE